jgi:hypothetical protein
MDATPQTHCTESLSPKAATIRSRLPSTITITVSSLAVDPSMNVEERPAERPGGLSCTLGLFPPK